MKASEDSTIWDSFVIEANEFLDAGGAGDNEAVARMLLENGQNEPEGRDNMIASVKALFKGMPGNPFGRRGTKSKVPAVVRVSIDTILRTVESAAVDYYNHDPVIAAVTKPHGRSKADSFDDAQDYANSVLKRTRTSLESDYKSGAWDGTLESLLSGDDSTEEYED